MVSETRSSVVHKFSDLRDEERELAGGKGGTLARLYQLGYPIPDGLVVLPGAFHEDELFDEAWKQIKVHLAQLRKGTKHSSLAIRSSALNEDSSLASFAGQFETVLNVSSDEDIRASINAVRRSRHNARVQTYSQSMGMTSEHQMAIVIQKMVAAELSGVVFTADPVTGDRNKMTGNFVVGSGEKLVSGKSEANSFTLKRPEGAFNGPGGMERFARKLFRLAIRLERELGNPQDIEWATVGRKVYILQSRPITTLIGWNPITGEANDTRTGDYVWSSVNIGEALSVVMTPFTSSIMRMAFDELNIVPGHASVGNIGGRLYQNSTVMITSMKALRQNIRDISTEMGGVRSEYMDKMDQYLVPLQVNRFAVVFKVLRMVMKQKQSLRALESFLSGNAEWCRKAYQRLHAFQNVAELSEFFRNEFWPRSLQSFWMTVATAWRYGQLVAPLRRELTNLVGAADANILLSNISSDDNLLESLGPVAGLSRVVKNRISREEYFEKWGHRGPLEGELSEPRPIEEQGWFDQLIAEYGRSNIDVEAMLATRKVAFSAAWEKFQNKYPRLKNRIEKRLERAAKAGREREAVRSEAMRLFWVLRAWAIKIGGITGIGNNIFYLTIHELLAHLKGRGAPTAYIPARQQTYAKYKSLPPYPLVIRGRFEPFQWVSDPSRDNRFFDSHGLLPKLYTVPGNTKVILGMPGSSGAIEGMVRRLDRPEDGGKLQPGEILVTSQTNIGWTLLFPKVAAIVTDVGAPLSHAAIVARELGIPAVVNCGDATSRLHTGDRVRVNGTQGTIEIL